MNVTVIGAGNSGLAMAAHLSKEGNCVTLWNRSKSTINKLIETHQINCDGIINGPVKIDLITIDIKRALKNPDIILITSPAHSHKELARLIAETINKETLIVLNPGRTFGALEFKEVYDTYNKAHKQTIAETQTIIYTCRKRNEDSVNIIAFKAGVLISTFNAIENELVIERLPVCLRKYFIPANSMIETSIGNVGMILHCAPLLLNTGWTESERNIYKYYYDGITPSVARLIEKIDQERLMVASSLGVDVESTQEWLQRTYHVTGKNLYECIQNNLSYKTIDAPNSIEHRYILEDVPCGLVPLEAVGNYLGIEMKYTKLIIDLASALLSIDFRENGRNLNAHLNSEREKDFTKLFTRRFD
jgi:opine dehydrogenase